MIILKVSKSLIFNRFSNAKNYLEEAIPSIGNVSRNHLFSIGSPIKSNNIWRLKVYQKLSRNHLFSIGSPINPIMKEIYFIERVSKSLIFNRFSNFEHKKAYRPLAFVSKSLIFNRFSNLI